jgi:hypothetical protein
MAGPSGSGAAVGLVFLTAHILHADQETEHDHQDEGADDGHGFKHDSSLLVATATIVAEAGSDGVSSRIADASTISEIPSASRLNAYSIKIVLLDGGDLVRSHSRVNWKPM